MADAYRDQDNKPFDKHLSPEDVAQEERKPRRIALRQRAKKLLMF